ncbi:MAG TPA: oxidoreductase [Deltaproteobacteria bacterium]|nr:MAG: oxidoreductase [Deltaproteobacteria bacterium GWA2_55_82]OGQ63526.1 MAG: oxidoreductase [Deltaproteobacteria bacterium RIFCSPLOWO2_02_FULL_55_12]OIJ74908.1 MAG: oxidoreductase [Deltaproteobacteria bacterium GWC2_55_46]HBG47438.1 oxidoreductase [Deltaproteobacteria bacterium]HCY11454.1 oxidoreductase [Deltaproteobacteria bacterium]
MVIRPGDKIKFAFVGCGAIANKHMAAIGRISEAEVSGVYDKDPAALEAFAGRYPVRPFSSLDEMIKEADPHVLVILTPSGIHAKNIMELTCFNRHFVVEKPLALRLEQIDRVLEECDKRGLKIFVVQQNRFNPPIRKTKEALDKGRFGKLVIGSVRVRWCRDQSYYDQKPWRGTWALDGGVLTNQASHHIDMLIWMMGEVESVMAKTASRLVSIEAEDTGVAVLRFKNGALGVIEATTATRPKDLEGSIGILGEKGAVEVGGFFMNELKIWSFSEPDDMDNDVWERHSGVPEGQAWNHTEFFLNVIGSLRSKRKALIDGLEGRKSVELINAIYESAETGKEVFLRFTPRMCRLGVNNDK